MMQGAELSAGINLAAAFPSTPFNANFENYLNNLGAKQNFETVLIKQLVTNFRFFTADAKSDGEIASAFAVLRRKLAERQATLDAKAREALQPVTHSLKVTPL